MITLAEIEEVLDQAEFTAAQSRALSKAIELSEGRQRELMADQLMTKVDGAQLKEEVLLRLEEIRNDMVRWMFAFWLGLIPVVALSVKYVK